MARSQHSLSGSGFGTSPVVIFFRLAGILQGGLCVFSGRAGSRFFGLFLVESRIVLKLFVQLQVDTLIRQFLDNAGKSFCKYKY
jgi:hypothetical protein